MNKTETSHTSGLGSAWKQQDGSVIIVTIAMIAILMLLVGTTLMSTANKYFTSYQWASWQESLQGAESGADIAMAEMRKDVNGTAGAFAGWTVAWGNCSQQIDSSGTYSGNCGNGGGNTQQFKLSVLQSHGVDSVTYKTSITPHAGEGNRSLAITTTIDAPAALSPVGGSQWLRVRSSGTVDVTGPSRVSEERLDNRLRKLILLWNKITGVATSGQPKTTRSIELVAKPVTLFSGALTAMVQLKLDKTGNVTDSFNSEDPAHWPLVNGTYDLTISHDPTSALGKNGDVASNAFPINHDHSEQMDINGNTIWGDVGNNYSQIKNLDSAYYGSTPQGYYDGNGIWQQYYGLNNENYGSSNPYPSLINTTGSGGGDVSGQIATNFYRDLPAVQDPGWTSSTPGYDSNVTIINNKTADYTASSDPTHPSRLKVSSITLTNADIWQIKTPPPPKGSPAGTVVDSYIEIWVTGNIKLDDGGQIDIKPGVHATVYFDHDLKVGENKETKSNAGGFYTESDDAKDLLLLGVTQPDAGKLPHDEYVDPLGNDSLYTPYKASGNIVFKENDFTGAIYAPDHNIVFDNTKDGKGKRNKRQQNGNDFYGSYVGRTIHSKQAHNFHFDESLNDSGPSRDWGYVSWFEDVDVDHR